MPLERILIADDTPEKLQAMKEIVERTHPSTCIEVAHSVREALYRTSRGRPISHAVIDFDFLPEGKTGDEIVQAVRRRSLDTRIVCATARDEGQTFEEAKDATMHAGADDALCFLREDFADKLTAFVG